MINSNVNFVDLETGEWNVYVRQVMSRTSTAG